MAKRKKIGVGLESPTEAPSEEFKAFEELAKKVLAVPKTELDRRETEYKKSRESRKSKPDTQLG